MMSVMPGTGSGTNDESTIDTMKSPASPKETSRCISRWPLLLSAASHIAASGAVA